MAEQLAVEVDVKNVTHRGGGGGGGAVWTSVDICFGFCNVGYSTIVGGTYKYLNLEFHKTHLTGSSLGCIMNIETIPSFVA